MMKKYHPNLLLHIVYHQILTYINNTYIHMMIKVTSVIFRIEKVVYSGNRQSENTWSGLCQTLQLLKQFKGKDVCFDYCLFTSSPKTILQTLKIQF